MIKLKPTAEALDFHYKEVSRVFNNVIKKGAIKRNNVDVNLPKCFIRFLSTNFDRIISSKPQDLIEVHNEFKLLGIIDSDIKNIKSFFLETGYKNFENKKFLNLLNIDTCVYCNRNYTLEFDLYTEHARAELDHWFPKTDFPILALSFYNLIPSCHSCNHIKSNANGFDWLSALKTLSHPYDDDDSEGFAFSYYYDNYNSMKVILKVKEGSTKTEETLKFNKIEKIYIAHSGRELRDLMDLRYKYSKNYMDILLNKTFKNLAMSEEEIYRMIFGIEIEEENYHKRPFSKFKHDIIKELKN
ncbi:hypothetical protein ACI6PS_10515 [Flavobacterium sp. PLA-1-15]|uniref:hypothetical protein n=1 Tax=Flavobacterium sp. PLA-1-15 TaxID=3380533 RepID=UPI003B764A8C